MNKDDIVLPALPSLVGFAVGNSDWTLERAFNEYAKSYARLAIEPYKKRIAELESKLEIVCVGDVSGQRLTSDRQRKGEPIGNVEIKDGLVVIGVDAKCLGDGVNYLYTAPQPIEEAFCAECGDGLVVEDPGICGTCYETKYVSPQTAEPIDHTYPTDEWVEAFFGNSDESGFYYFRGDIGNIAHRYQKAAKYASQQPVGSNPSNSTHSGKGPFTCGADLVKSINEELYEPVKGPSDDDEYTQHFYDKALEVGANLRYSFDGVVGIAFGTDVFESFCRVLLERYEHTHGMEKVECQKCGSDRSKEPCEGDIMECSFKGEAKSTKTVNCEGNHAFPPCDDPKCWHVRVNVRHETVNEHIARDIREGRFPEKSDRKTVPMKEQSGDDYWNGYAEGQKVCRDRYEGIIADHRRLVRELDVLLNGYGAAEQASLCDIVAQVHREGIKAARPEDQVELPRSEANLTVAEAKELLGLPENVHRIYLGFGLSVMGSKESIELIKVLYDRVENHLKFDRFVIPSDDEIREIFLANGFTLKPGSDDLKPYVYKAARALIARCAVKQKTEPEHTPDEEEAWRELEKKHDH